MDLKYQFVKPLHTQLCYIQYVNMLHSNVKKQQQIFENIKTENVDHYFM